MKYLKSNKRGSASFIALLLSLVIVLISVIFNWFIKEQLYFTEMLKMKMDSKLKNFTICNELTYSILTQRISQKSIIIDDHELYGIKEIPLDGGELLIDNNTKLRIFDTNGLISVSTMNINAFKNLIKNLTKSDPSIIIDSLLDWIDEDDLKRLNGFEKVDYRMEGKSYIPRNYPIQYKEELLLIKGITKEIYDNISKFLTIVPNNGFNPNTAPKEVLAAYLDIDYDVAKNLYDYIRSTGLLNSDKVLNDLVGRKIIDIDGVYYYPSRNFDIKIENIYDNNTIFTTSVGLIYKETLRSPYQIFYWKDE